MHIRLVDEVMLSVELQDIPNQIANVNDLE